MCTGRLGHPPPGTPQRRTKSPRYAIIASVMRAQLRIRRKQLKRLVGSPIYEDARIAIYAPWGDPLPCDGKRIEKDTESVPSGVVEEMRTVPDGNAQLFTRLIAPIPEATGTDSSDD